MADLKLVHSCSEARRVIAQGGVRVDGEKILDIDRLVKKNELIEVGIRKKKSARAS
tara:strand:+ start:2442 stop:2609 length:168 start_codon:yes stop_codon:yes gene_type:complete